MSNYSTFDNIKYKTLISGDIFSLHKLIETKKCDNKFNQAANKI